MRLFSLLPILLPAVVAAGQCSVTSAEMVTPVIELFTSEGCSSCPPADRWLSSVLMRKPAGEVIGLSLHVDYWNDLGWRDPYSSPAYSLRQRVYQAAGRTRGVYTPQVVVSGSELTDWFRGDGLEARQAMLREQHPLVRIDLAIQPLEPGSTAVLSAKAGYRWLGKQPPELAEAWLALVESGVSSTVRTGENAGRQLRHDGVVRAWLGPYKLPTDGQQLALRFPLQPSWNRDALSLVAMAQQLGAGRILQAVAMSTNDCRGGSQDAPMLQRSKL